MLVEESRQVGINLLTAKVNLDEFFLIIELKRGLVLDKTEEAKQNLEELQQKISKYFQDSYPQMEQYICIDFEFSGKIEEENKEDKPKVEKKFIQRIFDQ